MIGWCRLWLKPQWNHGTSWAGRWCSALISITVVGSQVVQFRKSSTKCLLALFEIICCIFLYFLDRDSMISWLSSRWSLDVRMTNYLFRYSRTQILSSVESQCHQKTSNLLFQIHKIILESISAPTPFMYFQFIIRPDFKAFLYHGGGLWCESVKY